LSLSADLDGTYWDFAAQSLDWICAANDMLDALDAKRAEMRERAEAEARAAAARKKR
jgi:hypothetical protein